MPVMASLVLAQSPMAIQVLDRLPDDLMTRVTMNGETIIYGVQRDGAWQLLGQPATQAGTSPPTVLMTAPPGHVLLSPALAPDGRLYFESNLRTPAIAGRDDSDVWVMERSGQGWSEARPLGSPFASEYNEHYPTLDAAGTLCFNSARPQGLGRNDIYCGARGSTEPPRLIASVSSPAQDASPWLSRDGTVLLFASNRPGGAGGWDLYVSRKESGHWAPPLNLGPAINTAGDETWVTLSASEDRLIFRRFEPGDKTGRVLVTSYTAVPSQG